MHLDHTLFPVPQELLEEEVAFMTAAFAHVGFKELARYPNVVGMGTTKAYYWLVGVKADESPVTKEDMGKGIQYHIGFSADNSDEVDRFYEAGLNGGGRDNGGPGIRALYSPSYYAAFLYSPSGINVEMVRRDGKTNPVIASSTTS